jgi:hypothetical protein
MSISNSASFADQRPGALCQSGVEHIGVLAAAVLVAAACSPSKGCSAKLSDTFSVLSAILACNGVPS